MTRFKLISFKLCPYVQRAAIVLLEKKVPFERVDIDLDDKPGWFLELSPLGKVPVLVVEKDGKEQVLFESSVIAEYLDEILEPRLHPADPLEKARHRAWIEFASATLADIYGLYAGDEAQFAAKIGAIETKFERLETILGESPFYSKPKLASWRKALAERPSVVDAVAADYGEALVRYVRDKGGHMAQLTEAAMEAEPA